MKTLVLIGIVCCLGYSQAVSHDDIKGIVNTVESVIKCVVDSHDDLNDVEDLVQRLESLAVDNGKLKETRAAIGAFLKERGIQHDENRGLFGLALDVFNGIKQAYEEGKDDEILDFVKELLVIIPEGGFDAAFKIIGEFMMKEQVIHCLPGGDKGDCGGDKKRALNISRRRNTLMKLLNKY